MKPYPDIWKQAPIEGEVEYNWQKQRESAEPAETFGRTPDETMKVPAYRRFMMDKIRRYHASYLGWIEWLAGEDWDSAAFAYRRPAVPHHEEGHATLPADIKPGQYIVALAILDRQGGMLPSARFAIANYYRGGWHPLGSIGIGMAPHEAALKNGDFDSPAFDDSLCYKVPEKLRAVKVPPLPQVGAVTPWSPDPNIELIDASPRKP